MNRLEEVVRAIPPLDGSAMEGARKRQDTLTKPRGALGVLEELSIRIAGMTGCPVPRIKDKVIVTMAGDHGVAEEGVSAYPKEVTAQMVHNFVRGGAGINVLGRHVGARVVVVDMGVAAELGNLPGIIKKKVAPGTRNIARGSAMTRDEALKSIGAGIEVVESELETGMDIVGTGDMGIANTTSSSAIVAAITGSEVKRVTGRGTGVDDAALARKVGVIERALEVNRPDPRDPIDVLSKVGGFEIGGLAGVILAAAAGRIPVVIDGFISGAAALIATGLAPRARDYLIAAHRSAEPGHKVTLEHLRLKPLLELDLRLGEGTGAALGIFMAEAACGILAEMATFENAGVSNRDGGEVHGQGQR